MGHACAALSALVAGIAEIHRKDHHQMEQTLSGTVLQVSSMSCFQLAPQYILLGIAEAFVTPACKHSFSILSKTKNIRSLWSSLKDPQLNYHGVSASFVVLHLVDSIIATPHYWYPWDAQSLFPPLSLYSGSLISFCLTPSNLRGISLHFLTLFYGGGCFLGAFLIQFFYLVSGGKAASFFSIPEIKTRYQASANDKHFDHICFQETSIPIRSIMAIWRVFSSYWQCYWP